MREGLLENGGQRVVRRKCRHKDTARLAAVGCQVEIPAKEGLGDIKRLKIAGGMFILRGYAVRAKGQSVAPLRAKCAGDHGL